MHLEQGVPPLVFIAPCRRGKNAPSTPRGASAISHGDRQKNQNQFGQNSPGETVGEQSHFSPPRAFLHQNSPLEPLFPSPQLLSGSERKQPNKQQINYSETTCVVRGGIKCWTEPECSDFIVLSRGEGSKNGYCSLPLTRVRTI